MIYNIHINPTRNRRQRPFFQSPKKDSIPLQTGTKYCGREEGIIVPLDRQSGQLRSTSPGRHRLPYFVYTGCRCRRGWCRRGLLLFRLLYQPEPSSRQALCGLPQGCWCRWAGVEEASLVYTGLKLWWYPRVGGWSKDLLYVLRTQDKKITKLIVFLWKLMSLKAGPMKLGFMSMLRHLCFNFF